LTNCLAWLTAAHLRGSTCSRLLLS